MAEGEKNQIEKILELRLEEESSDPKVGEKLEDSKVEAMDLEKKEEKDIEAKKERPLMFDAPLKDVDVEGRERALQTLKWRVTDRYNYQDFVFEWDDGKFLFYEKKVERLTGIRNIKRYLYYIVDFIESPAMGTITIAGDYKYAQVLARKELEDRGDLTTDGRLWVYKKKKMDPTQSVVVYNIFPAQKYNSLYMLCKRLPKGMALFDTVAMLFNILNTLNKSHVHALALKMGESILLLVGRKDEVYLLRRYGMVGRDDISVGETIQSIIQDLLDLEERLGGETISQLNWIEAFTFELIKKIPETAIPVYPWPVTELIYEEQRCYSALPNIVGSLSLKYSIGPREEKYLKVLENIQPWVMTLCVGLICALGVGFYVYQNAVSALSRESNNLKQKIASLQNEISSIKLTTPKGVDLNKFLKTASMVEEAYILPKLGDMWNVLSTLRPYRCKIEGVDISYSPEMVTINLSGNIESSMGEARSIFMNYLSSLKKVGFEILNKQLRLDLENNAFALTVGWKVKRGK